MDSQRFSADVRGKNRVPLGDPLGDTIWSDIAATVTYDDDHLRVKLHATFDGDRVNVQRLEVARTDDAPLRSSDLAKLVLGQVVRDVTRGAVHPGHGALVGRQVARGTRPTPDELKLVASVYWFEHAAGASPRQAVMGYWGVPRATANRWIRMARELYPMPGPHSGEEG